MNQLSNLCLPFSVTSIPDVEWLCNPAIASTGYKELRLDPLERMHVQENLDVIKEVNSPLEMELSLEQLARGFAYHIGQEGAQISIPVNGQMISYQTEEIPLWMGISAYGLTPINGNGPPILLFRGSSFYPSGKGALATFVADLDPTGVGHIAYKWGAKNIQKWFEGKSDVLVTGHSLGAVLATYAAIDNQENVKEVQTHGGVGCSIYYHRKYEELTNKPLIRNFYHPDDPLIHAGHKRIGTDIKVVVDVGNEGKGAWRQKSFTHRASLLDKAGSLSEERVKMSLPHWMHTALFVIPFIIMFTFLVLSRLLFGSYQKLQPSLFGGIRQIWHRHLETHPT